MRCKECGKLIEDNCSFCKYCGSRISPDKISVLDTPIKPAEVISKNYVINNNISCPLYKHIDDIKKVSAVYDLGVSEGRYIGSAVNYSSYEYSSVSMGGFNITNTSRKLAPPPPPVYPSQALMVVFIVLGAISLITLIGPVVFGLLAYWQGSKNSTQTKKAKEYTPIYEKAYIKWDKLYYCFRDDIVFDPETNEFVTADNINSLVFKGLYNQKEISGN